MLRIAREGPSDELASAWPLEAGDADARRAHGHMRLAEDGRAGGRAPEDGDAGISCCAERAVGRPNETQAWFDAAGCDRTMLGDASSRTLALGDSTGKLADI